MKAGETALVVAVAESGPLGPAEPRLPLAFESFLYLRPAHQALQAAGPVLSFYLEAPAAGRTVAQLHVALGPAAGEARSPAQAPFGGIQLAAGLPLPALHQLLDAAETELRQRGVRRLALRSYPFAYHPAGAASQAEALRQRSYRVALAEQNYHLDPARDYEAHLHPSERRRLHKCRRAGLHFEQEPPFLLPAAYEFIEACRQERGQALSLPLARVQELFRRFPKEHFLFSVRQADGEWAALTVAIQVDKQVLYNFYPASPLRCNSFSPVVLLNEGLHAFARASGMAVLDLGTSTLDSGPNASLLRFKRHLGGVAGLRLSWEREL
ncbi:GNAT family N-acetyltransferase [Hymenobacter negativus]|uniref:GNAT family N-acetyltransferase n=1 Tax=Hymenobacter negativus TaxID=2795026 RepID=A0ABS0Q300_9BACT|nr:GNAT family N-acetyltransferase [Hymenobacter negativus]MBH8556887.1 GNAT family N-acetyltransferase [Hymenobacter negativus]